MRALAANEPAIATGTELLATGLDVMLDMAKIDPRVARPGREFLSLCGSVCN
ncbi:MAG TPA: hypothetical protein VGP62_30725 [Bryobacteraceae bacterium]|jgi:hypothetical protein|nr:hypothetical protein [Bryobacteraceae bacterium]